MKLRIVFALMFISAFCFGQENKVYNVILTTPGTILEHIDLDSIYKVTELTISGEINKTDIDVIKNMNNLKRLNISDATILQYNEAVLRAEINRLKNIYLYNIQLAADACKTFSSPEIQKLNNDLVFQVEKVKKFHQSGAVLETELFHNFTSLESVYLPKSLQFIGNNAFINCTNLEKIFIVSNIQSIGAYSFSGCPKLKELSILNVQEINPSFICGCDSLKIIHCYSKIPPKISKSDYNCSLSKYDGVLRKDILFYFPKQSVSAYFVSDWSSFFTIKTE